MQQVSKLAAASSHTYRAAAVSEINWDTAALLIWYADFQTKGIVSSVN